MVHKGIPSKKSLAYILVWYCIPLIAQIYKKRDFNVSNNENSKHGFIRETISGWIYLEGESLINITKFKKIAFAKTFKFLHRPWRSTSIHKE